jgi:hypothetical protein
LTLIKTNLWKGITVVSAFALALVLVFGSGSSNVKTANAAACTLDVASVWAAGDTNNTIACTVSAGVDQLITVTSEDLVGSHKMYNDNDPNAGLGDTINVKVDGLTTAVTAATGIAKQVVAAPTAAKPHQLKTTFTVNSATPGVAIIAVDQSIGYQASTGALCAANAAADDAIAKRCDVHKTGATQAASENIIILTVIGKPVDSSDTTDDDADGNADTCDKAGDDCSNFAAVTTASGDTTDTAPYDIQDALGTQLTGYSTLTLTDAPSTTVFTSTGSQTLIVANTTATNEAAAISGLPKTGNFRYGLSLAFVGTSGSRTLTSTISRTDGVVAAITATPLKAATAGTCTLVSSATDKAWDHASIVADASADTYYWKVNVVDSAGNPVTTANAIKVGDADGLTANGFGNAATGGFDVEICDGDEDATATSFTADAKGNAYIALHIANELDANAAGEYTIEFKNNAAGTIKATDTFTVSHATASKNTYAVSGPANLAANEIGIYTVTCADLNGNPCNANVAASHVVTGLGTTGSSVPTVGTAITITPTLGATVTVVAPAGGGSGTVGVIISSKVVASQAVSYTAASTAAAVSGTGCSATTTGSYTCVVTSGGTAAEVATAAGAVSVWQSDANGVLQGYVVGTPDFVSTGLASTAAIASNSAVIVVR